MSTAVKNIMVRVIKRQMAAGSTFDEAVANYPKLTEDEIAELKEAVE